MDKNLLIMTEMPEYFVSLADKNFNTYKLWLNKNEDDYLSEIKTEVDAIAVMGGYKITPELMKSMPNLKIIACYGVGYDAIDINYAKSLGIKVTNTPEASPAWPTALPIRFPNDFASPAASGIISIAKKANFQF